MSRASDRAVQDAIARLSDEERMLIVLKTELYEGRWDEMATDLESRLGGKPYIFKLAHRIEDDLERIDRLRALEAELGVDLGQYVRLEDE